MNDRELTLTDLLADPMILAVMAAYQVDVAALEAALSGLARRLELARPAAGGVAAALSPAPEAEAPFANSLRPVKRAPTDQMRQSGWQERFDTNRRTTPVRKPIVLKTPVWRAAGLAARAGYGLGVSPRHSYPG